MKLLLLLFLLFSLYGKAQKNKEFEGVIEYKQSLVFTQSDLDTGAIKKMIGSTCTFYYKNGNYKWIVNPALTEYFDTKTQTVYFLERNNDTLFRSSPNGYDDSLELFKDSVTEIISGYKCETARIVSFTKGTQYSPFTRIISYSTNIVIDPYKFRNYRSYSTNKVLKRIKSWPLKIQLKNEFLPFIITMEAVKIERRKLNDTDVLKPARRIIQDRF